MSSIELTKNSPNFDFKQVDVKQNTPKQIMKYISKYFIPLTDGNHIFFVNGKYTIYDQATVKKTYFDRMSVIKDGDGNDVFNPSKWYFTKYSSLRTITYELNKPVLHDDKINLCPKMKHTYQPFKDFSDEIKAKVFIMQNYILEVLASSNKEQYDFIIQWFSYMVKGKKTNLFYIFVEFKELENLHYLNS